jgi:uncharacterized protein GlcG (DUF336 family)
MKFIFLSFFFLFLSVDGANGSEKDFLAQSNQLTLKGAQELASKAQEAAQKIDKVVTIVIVGNQGETILVYKGDGIGPHNTEAARRKAFTSLSTKTATLLLARNARSNPDTNNLAQLPELLLLSGGHPLLKDGIVIGAIGVAGGGSPENDDLIASQAELKIAGILTKK